MNRNTRNGSEGSPPQQFVAASRQSAANPRCHFQRHSAETPLMPTQHFNQVPNWHRVPLSPSKGDRAKGEGSFQYHA